MHVEREWLASDLSEAEETAFHEFCEGLGLSSFGEQSVELCGWNCVVAPSDRRFRPIGTDF
jgi:hypothetical protein